MGWAMRPLLKGFSVDFDRESVWSTFFLWLFFMAALIVVVLPFLVCEMEGVR